MSSEITAILDEIAEFDWKSESQDVLFSIRDAYQKKYPVLLQKEFDELAENYAAEPTEDFVNALGQELSAVNYLLYEIDTDSDSYTVVMIRTEEEEALKGFLKQQKKKGILKKQPRRKIGSSAKRIDMGKRLPCEKFSLNTSKITYHLTDNPEGTLWLDYSQYGEIKCFKSFDTAVFNMESWPPVQEPDLGLLVRMLVRNEDGTYVAITQSNSVNEQGYLSDTSKMVMVGRDCRNIRDWRCVYAAKEFKWTNLFWFENELFAADRNNAYRIKDVDRFTDSMERVLALKEGDVRIFPEFFVLGNTLYLYMLQSIYKWEMKRSFFKKEYHFKKIYTLEGFHAQSFVPVGDHKVAFQVRPEYTRRGVTEAELTVLDVHSLKTEKYPCHYGYVKKWTENRVCVLTTDVTSKMPIIECFDFDTNEKRCLKYGALGKDCVNHIFETKCGTVLVNGGNFTFYKVDDLWDFMEKG